MPRSSPVQCGLARSSSALGSTFGSLSQGGHFLVHTNPLMMMGYLLIPPLQIEPLVGGVGAEGAAIAVVAVTPMELAPPGEGVK